jgi:hypothetical protein
MARPSPPSLAARLIASGLALLLAGCNLPPPTPMWGPDSPRNGALQPVDPAYGTPIPGYPLINRP